MIQKEVKLHVEDAMTDISLLVQTASRYESKLFFNAGDVSINAKSLMGMFTLVTAGAETLTLLADGPDENDAVEAILALLK